MMMLAGELVLAGTGTVVAGNVIGIGVELIVAVEEVDVIVAPDEVEVIVEMGE